MGTSAREPMQRAACKLQRGYNNNNGALLPAGRQQVRVERREREGRDAACRVVHALGRLRVLERPIPVVWHSRAHRGRASRGADPVARMGRSARRSSSARLDRLRERGADGEGRGEGRGRIGGRCQKSIMPSVCFVNSNWP